MGGIVKKKIKHQKISKLNYETLKRWKINLKCKRLEQDENVYQR
jgi:hypothetical protein